MKSMSAKDSDSHGPGGGSLPEVKGEHGEQYGVAGEVAGVKLGKSWRFDMERIERLFAGVPHIDKDRQDWDRENTEKEE